MTTRATEVDPAVLRALLRRLGELEDEAHGVTDAVLNHLPYAGPGMAEVTVAEVGAALVDAFSHLADSVTETRRAVTASSERYVDVDLTVVRDLDRLAR
jgi:hypothetical protein